MRRIGLAVAIAISLFAAPIAAQAQPAGKVWRIGILQTSAQKDEPGRVAALEQGLAELGYAGGRNIVLVNRNAGQQVDRLPEFTTDLVRAGVDVMVTSTNPVTLAAKQATATIPIVMTVGVEPVAAGLVASLAKPGANVTGLTFDVDATQLAAKRLEILKELMPSVSRVAVLWNPGYAPGSLRFEGNRAGWAQSRHHDCLGPLLGEKRRGACVHRDPPSQGRGRHCIVRSGHRRTTTGHHRNGSAISGASDLRAARMGRGRRPHLVRNQPQ